MFLLGGREARLGNGRGGCWLGRKNGAGSEG